MSQVTTPSARPRRITIPWLMDLVLVADPEHIRTIDNSGDVDRLHAYETAALPWWVRGFFRATKFHDAERDLWFFPFEATTCPHYDTRQAYLQTYVDHGYTDHDVITIAELLQTGAADDELAHAMVQVVNRRFLGTDVPRPITRAAKDTLQNLSEALLPWKYIRARKAQKHILRYCAHTLPEDVHLVDVGHNIGEVVQATAGALRRLQNNLDQPVEAIFTAHAPTPQVARIAVKASTFGGLLSSPTRPGKTVVILQIAKAAAQTQDILFTFGTGKEERACVFKEFFMNFMQDVQRILREAAEQPD